ncbi:hypothetical protein AX16_002602 [Volvariella volvacea WC 439]|nr:hypothetical protein AX16_002602 [Volvariella volvacea WC 439]
MFTKLRRLATTKHVEPPPLQPEGLPDPVPDPPPVIQPLFICQPSQGDFVALHLGPGHDFKSTSKRQPLVASHPAPRLQTIPFHVLTWNIDFATPHQEQRLTSLLDHLSQLLTSQPGSHSSTGPTSTNTIILLQELHSKCFPTLLSHPFVRSAYAVTDTTKEFWRFGTHYGLVTLVPVGWVSAASGTGVGTGKGDGDEAPLRAVDCSVFRVKFKGSLMARDVVFVDLDLDSDIIQVAGDKPENIDSSTNDNETPAKVVQVEKKKHQRPGTTIWSRISSTNKSTPPSTKARIKIRIASSHLESLPFGASERVHQLTLIAQYLQASGVHVGILGGDMNCDTPGDEGLPGELELRDAWVERTNKPGDGEGGTIPHNSPEGCTFGYQSTRKDEELIPRRLDKVLVTGHEKVRIGDVIRIGIDVKVEVAVDMDHSSEGTDGKQMVWVSDHYGLLARVVVG